MNKEIRGLKAGSYYSQDGTALLRVTRKDQGVIIEIADFDADIFYEFVVDDDQANFSWGKITVPQQEDADNQEGDPNGTDTTSI